MFHPKQKTRAAAGQQYAIIVGLIGVVALFAIGQMGSGVNSLMTRTGDTLTQVVNGTVGSGGSGGGGGGGGGQTPVDYFSDVISAAQGLQIQSAIVQIPTGGAVSISGAAGSPAYRVCADASCSTAPAFTSTAGSIAGGQYLQLALTSASSAGVTRTMSVIIGSASDTWAVTTTSWGPGSLSALSVGGGWQLRCTQWVGSSCRGMQINIPSGQCITAGWWNMNNANATDGQTACDRFCRMAVGSTYSSCTFEFPSASDNPNPGQRLYSWSSGTCSLGLPGGIASVAPLSQTHSFNNNAVVCPGW